MTAFDDLRADPRAFLWNTPLSIHGAAVFGTLQTYAETTPSAADASHPATCRFSAIPSAEQTTAWNVPMIQSATAADIGNLNHIHVPDTTTPLIVTGGLTGCCVAVAAVSPTELRIAHVQPGGNWQDGTPRGDSAALETSMRAGCTMGGVAATHFCGASTYRRVGVRGTFVGVVVNGAWQCWVQSTSGTTNRTIVHLSRIL